MTTIHPLVSIIIPVYQVEKYLKECTDSVFKQSYENWELLLIDDGSTDGGGRMCDELAAADARVEVVHQKNAGLSAARNRGLDIATGEYIAMVDSDDVLISNKYLESMMRMLLKHKAQVCLCGAVTFSDGDKIPEEEMFSSDEQIFSGRDIFLPGNLSGPYFLGAAHMKIYDRSCFDGVRYPEGKLVEDNAVIHRILYPCERVVISGRCMYGYRGRKNSIMGSSDAVRLYKDAYDAFSDRVKYFEEQQEPELVRIAKKTERAHLFFYHKKCLTDKTIDDVPEEIRLSGDDAVLAMETGMDRKEIYSWLESIAPEKNSPLSQNFLKRESKRGLLLSKIAYASFMQEETERKIEYDEGDEKMLIAMSKDHGLYAAYLDFIIRNGSLKDKKLKNYRAAFDRQIYKNIRADAETEMLLKELSENGVEFSQLYDNMIREFLPGRIFRRPATEIGLADEKNLTKIRSLMKEKGYNITEKTGGGLNAEKDGIKIFFLAALSAGDNEKDKKYFRQLGKEMLKEKKELSPSGQFIYMAAKIKGAKEKHEAKMSDILDAGIFLRQYVEINEGSGWEDLPVSEGLKNFANRLNKVSLMLTEPAASMKDMTKEEEGFLDDIIGCSS